VGGGTVIIPRPTLSNVPAAGESALRSTPNHEDDNASTNVSINDNKNDKKNKRIKNKNKKKKI
jgi:hypothetical protein